jgi:Tfp pilus assembly protein PilN
MRAVNLLPPDLRSGPKGSAPAVPSGVENSGAGAFVVLGVLALCVFALAAYVLAGNTVKDRKAELAAATSRAAAVERQAAALKPYADFESVANARVQTVTDLAHSRFDWEQALRDLSRAVPADVTIASFRGDLGSAEGGTGGGGIRGAITAPAITLTGCTYSQTKVATLMARLRNIDGVTRVSLSKSDKEATAGAGSGADNKAPSATGYCGRSGVPSFELVVFFEGAASASTAPAPGAAAAAATTAAAAATPAPAGTAATPAPGAAATPAPAAGTAAPAATTAPAATPVPASTTP